MSVELLELVVTRKAAFGQRGELVEREIAEGIGCLAGVEQKTEVGRRNPGGLNEAFFLDIVGDQEVVVHAAKLVEEPPRTQSELPQKEDFLLAQVRMGVAGRLIQPSRDDAGRNPKAKGWAERPAAIRAGRRRPTRRPG